MTGRILLLSPSRGLGGGIERYVETLESSFAAEDVACQRLDLARAGPRAHAGLLARGRAVLRANPEPTRLVAAHRALLPVAALLAREPAARGVSVLCHGSEIWDSRFRPRRGVERRLMRRADVRVVAVSSFTAGALLRDCRATVLPPALSREWFHMLVAAASGPGGPDPGVRLVTAFRLGDWRGKGLGRLVAAVTALGRPDVSLTICGSGDPPPDLLRLVSEHPWCTLRPGLSDEGLARELAAADLFVLATQTRGGRRAVGEGFGLVLLEAQVAGTPVIAPAHGGSRETYVDGVTGVAPVDESAEALARTLHDLLKDPAGLAEMGGLAARWARQAFAPECYAQLVVSRLLLPVPLSARAPRPGRSDVTPLQEDAVRITAAAEHGHGVVARPVLVALLLLATSAGLLAETLDTADTPARAVVWGGLAMAAYGYCLLGMVLASRRTGQGIRSWRFGPWMMIWCGTMYGLATVTLGQQQSGSAAEIALPNVLRALWLVAVGTTMWALGYVLGPGRLLRGGAARVAGALQCRFSADVRGPLTPWLLYGIGTAARAASALTTSRLGYVGDAASAVSTASGYGQVVILLGLCAPAAVAAAALQVFRQRLRAARVTLAVLFLAEIGFDVASGQKENFVLAVLAIAIPYSAARSRLPTAMLAAFGIVFLAVVIPFTQAYRHTARGSAVTLTAGQAVGAVPGLLRATLNSENNLLTVVPRSIGDLLRRSQDIDGPAIIMQRTPGQIGFSSPVDLVTGPLSAQVPRALWPAKPILATGYQFSRQYYELPATVYTSSTITPIGDLYRHGGWVPVIAGMLVLGCGIRLLDDVLDVRANPHAVFLVLFLFPSLVMSEQDWITLLAGIPPLVLVWLLTVALAFRRRPEFPGKCP